MGTLATFFRKSDFFPGVDLFSTTGNAEAKPKARAKAAADQFKLRALPNDDVYFYVKRIDNSRVVRQADPQSKGQCLSAIGGACMLAVLAGSVMVPKLGSVLTGYKIQQLRQEQSVLHEEKRALEVDEAMVMSLTRLDELSRKPKLNLNRPVAGQVVHLQPKSEGAYASAVIPAALNSR